MNEIDMNQGTIPMPVEEKSDALEAVIDPPIQTGTVGLAPGATLLRIEHPRFGWLTFLLSADVAANVAKVMVPRD